MPVNNAFHQVTQIIGKIGAHGTVTDMVNVIVVIMFIITEPINVTDLVSNFFYFSIFKKLCLAHFPDSVLFLF